MQLTNYTFFNPKKLLYIKHKKGLHGYGLKYRFAFNGQEKDDEVKGSGNHLSFGDYGYDTRLGRRWQLDPEPIIGVSGYSAFNDNPILYADPDGKFPIIPIIAAAVAYYSSAKIMERSEGNANLRTAG